MKNEDRPNNVTMPLIIAERRLPISSGFGR